MAEGIDYQIDEVSKTFDDSMIDKIKIKHLDSRKVICQKADINNQANLELAIHQLKNKVLKGSPVIIGLVGVSIACDRLLSGDYLGYDLVFIHSSEDTLAETDDTYIKELEAGRYLCISFIDNNHSKSSVYYKKLMDYTNNNNLTVTGDSVERVIINEYKTNDVSEYLTEIQIPIKEKQ